METVLITEQDFDIDAEYSALKTAGVGAVVIFAGIVRDSADNPELRAMTLEHYPGMTEKEITIITEQARARWPLQGCVLFTVLAGYCQKRILSLSVVHLHIEALLLRALPLSWII